MNRTLGLIVFVLALVAASISERQPSDVKVQHVGNRAVIITCKDGADPTYDKVLSERLGGLVISCGTEGK